MRISPKYLASDSIKANAQPVLWGALRKNRWEHAVGAIAVVGLESPKTRSPVRLPTAFIKEAAKLRREIVAM